MKTECEFTGRVTGGFIMASATSQHTEPVFLLRRDLPPIDPTRMNDTEDQYDRYSALEICLAAERVAGRETILGAQEIRGLWRIYPMSRPARNLLLIGGNNR